MSELTGLKQTTSEQHDFNDLSTMVSWIKSHDSFEMSDAALCSISSGLATTSGDGINCGDAENVGEAIQMSMDNAIFAVISFQRKDGLKTLETLQMCMLTHILFS